MKTYTESKNGFICDWNTFLTKSEISKDDWNRATELSQGWVTCACGNQCVTLPRGNDGEPLDSKLFNLGKNFHYAIMNCCFYCEPRGAVNIRLNKEHYESYLEIAIEILKAIEERSAELLAEII